MRWPGTLRGGLLLPLPTLAATLQGTIVGVQDGDTLPVLDTSRRAYKIRLSGSETAERKQPFGTDSKHALSAMVYERTVTTDYCKDHRSGRKVGKVLVDGIDANLVQVEARLARHYKKYQKETPLEERLVYSRVEVDAREAGRGLWKGAGAVPS